MKWIRVFFGFSSLLQIKRGQYWTKVTSLEIHIFCLSAKLCEDHRTRRIKISEAKENLVPLKIKVCESKWLCSNKTAFCVALNDVDNGLLCLLSKENNWQRANYLIKKVIRWLFSLKGAIQNWLLPNLKLTFAHLKMI